MNIELKITFKDFKIPFTLYDHLTYRLIVRETIKIINDDFFKNKGRFKIKVLHPDFAVIEYEGENVSNYDLLVVSGTINNMIKNKLELEGKI